MTPFPACIAGVKTPQDSSMCWGFECDDGWFDLIWNLSQAIEDAARHEGLEPESEDWPEATQVKQKFGTLRFHLNQHTEAISALIEEAGAASEKICEVCGASASSVDNARRWCKTLCSIHAEEFLRNSPPARQHSQPPVWKIFKD